MLLPRTLSIVAFLLSSAPIIVVHAWGAAGHEIVGTIAQIFLTPNARQSLCEILPPFANCHLAPIASWADRVRNSYTGPLHYINDVDDWPADRCSFGGGSSRRGGDEERGGGMGGGGWTDKDRNVFVGIYNSTRNVLYLSGSERDFALRYLVHFMGDLHMPLHLVGRDRGGNKVPVRFDHRITNLHSVWDGRLIAKHIRTLTNYTEPLPSKTIESALRGAIYDSYVRFIVWEGILGWWKDEYLHWASCPATSAKSELAKPPLEEPLDAELLPMPHDEDFSTGPTEQHPLQGLVPLRDPSRSASPPPLESLPVCPLHWATPIHALNCNSTLIWPRYFSDIPPNTPIEHIPAKDLIELDTPQYAGRIRNELVIERLLATAGVRLAAVLNDLLDPVDDGYSYVRVGKQ